jgi:hypothetical protein
MLVRESQVEDVLATYTDLAQRILGTPEPVSLLARQMDVPSGRLDLLYVSGQQFLVVELKVEDATPTFVAQVAGYAADLRAMQDEGRLASGPVVAVLLCPSFDDETRRTCAESNVRPVEYAPEEVLSEFFRRLRALSRFIGLRPSDHGIWNIHLIHRVLYRLHRGPAGPKEIAHEVSLVPGTVSNQLRFAGELGLTERAGRLHQLTALGTRYIEERDPDLPWTHLSDAQAALLREAIVKNPFASPVIFGIYSLVETVFNLARNTYPVDRKLVIANFRDTTGKLFDWAADKSAYHGTRMYSNYGIELGLLGRTGDSLYLTPAGLRFILLLQLHRSLQLIDAVYPS